MFEIDADNLYWINGQPDDPTDLCLHGHAVAYIGNEKVEYNATVSATALYLLKTLTEDHIIYDSNQMLPCCGHWIIADDNLENVDICGCPNGVDWSVIHDGNFVKLILESGYEVMVPLSDYREEVYRFADKIEAFYRSCREKIIPENEFDRNGYIAFWNEWHRRRQQL